MFYSLKDICFLTVKICFRRHTFQQLFLNYKVLTHSIIYTAPRLGLSILLKDNQPFGEGYDSPFTFPWPLQFLRKSSARSSSLLLGGLPRILIRYPLLMKHYQMSRICSPHHTLQSRKLENNFKMRRLHQIKRTDVVSRRVVSTTKASMAIQINSFFFNI